MYIKWRLLLVVAFYILFVYMICRHPHKKKGKTKSVNPGDPFGGYEVPGWEQNVSRESNLYIRYDEVTSVIVPKLRGPDEKSKFHILIAIPSAPLHRARRDIIRRYSGHDCAYFKQCEYMFVLGRPKGSNSTEVDLLQADIAEEAANHEDILQEDFFDDYFNLTLKSVFTLKFFDTLTNKYTHLLKVDDDCFFSVPKLLEICKSLEKKRSPNWILGTLWRHTEPMRNSDLIGTKNGRWLMPNYMFSGKYYPSYFGGPGYMMTRSVAKCSLERSKSKPLLFLEDIYVTGICLANKRCNKAIIHKKTSPTFRLVHSPDDNYFDPSNDAVIHDVTDEQYRRWYLLLLLQQIESDDIDDSTRDSLIQRLEGLLRKKSEPEAVESIK